MCACIDEVTFEVSGEGSDPTDSAQALEYALENLRKKLVAEVKRRLDAVSCARPCVVAGFWLNVGPMGKDGPTNTRRQHVGLWYAEVMVTPTLTWMCTTRDEVDAGSLDLYHWKTRAERDDAIKSEVESDLDLAKENSVPVERYFKLVDEFRDHQRKTRKEAEERQKEEDKRIRKNRRTWRRLVATEKSRKAASPGGRPPRPSKESSKPRPRSGSGRPKRSS